MRRAIFLIGIVGAVVFGATNSAQAQGGPCDSCSEFAQRGALHVETDPGILDNFRLPIFSWPECPGATTYNIYVKDQLQASVEGVNTWTATSEYAYGGYLAYVQAVFPDLSTCTSQQEQFRIGISPPTELQPNHGEGEGTWKLQPVFTFLGSKGAQGYSVKLTRASGEVEVCRYSLPTPEGRDGVDIERYECQMPENLSMDPGEEAGWRVDAWTEVDGVIVNKVESEKANVRIKLLTPPWNITPCSNDPEGCAKVDKESFSTVVRSESDKPGLTWSHELLEAGEEVVLELYFVTNESGLPDPTKDQRVTDEGAMSSQWRQPEMLEPGGEPYLWYVVARKEGQEQVGPVWEIILKEPIGLGIGIKLGGNGLRTSNALSRLRVQPGGGIYVDQRIKRWGKFTLKAEFDLILEGRSVGFRQQDNPEFVVEDLHIDNLHLSPGLYIKPMFGLTESLSLYALVGAEATFVLMSRIINSQATEKVIEQTENIGVTLVGAIGANYEFDVNYLFGRKLELGLVVQYNQGLLDFLNGKSFLGYDSSQQQEFQVFLTNRLVDF